MSASRQTLLARRLGAANFDHNARWAFPLRPGGQQRAHQWAQTTWTRSKSPHTIFQTSCTNPAVSLATESSGSQNQIRPLAAVHSRQIPAAQHWHGSITRRANAGPNLIHGKWKDVWRRGLHTSARTRGEPPLLRYKSTKADEDKAPGKGIPPGQTSKTGVTGDPEHDSIANSTYKYIQSHLPKMPHRPTREELLAAANGFWERLKVRFKWFSIRSMRPWNADEWGAFVSWIFFGHVVWILVGTTTFFSLLIFMVNTVFAQGALFWVAQRYARQSLLTLHRGACEVGG
jgi:hypothetical protein